MEDRYEMKNERIMKRTFVIPIYFNSRFTDNIKLLQCAVELRVLDEGYCVPESLAVQLEVLVLIHVRIVRGRKCKRIWERFGRWVGGVC
jgi:hypothetical protein